MHQRVNHVGESEGLPVAGRIGVQTLPYLKYGSRLPTGGLSQKRYGTWIIWKANYFYLEEAAIDLIYQVTQLYTRVV